MSIVPLFENSDEIEYSLKSQKETFTQLPENLYELPQEKLYEISEEWGKYQIPRELKNATILPVSLTSSYFWINAPFDQKYFFQTLITHISRRPPFELDAHGTKIIVKPGQICTSYSELVKMLGKGKATTLKKLVQRSLKNLEKVGILKTIIIESPKKIQVQKKTFITITHPDTYDIILKQAGTKQAQRNQKKKVQTIDKNKNDTNHQYSDTYESNLLDHENEKGTKELEKKGTQNKRILTNTFIKNDVRYEKENAAVFFEKKIYEFLNEESRLSKESKVELLDYDEKIVKFVFDKLKTEPIKKDYKSAFFFFCNLYRNQPEEFANALAKIETQQNATNEINKIELRKRITKEISSTCNQFLTSTNMPKVKIWDASIDFKNDKGKVIGTLPFCEEKFKSYFELALQDVGIQITEEIKILLNKLE